MIDNSVSSNGFPGSVPVVTNPPPGRTNPSSPYKGASRALGVTALLAALAVGLLFLLPGGLAWAQDAESIDYPEKGTNPVATYTASDPEGASVRWSLSGVDAEDFTIEDGVLRFAKTPDYESAKGGATDTNTYTVVVKATDETRRVASKTVMVKVTNVDEEGKVELSALRPQSATALTATLSDPDGATSNAKWQWSKSSSKNGAYSPIDKATSATYIPKDGDIPFYLRATVTYTDPEGEDKTAKMESDFTVQGVRGSNMAPEFAADQDPNTPEVVENAARSVAENTEAGSTVGDPVTADPKDGDVLTYTLEDEDGRIDGPSANFDIDRATGQILTKKALDYEATGGPSYTFVVRATDPAGVPGADATADASDTVTVVITVTDVNDAPVVGGMEDVAFQETTDTLTSWSETYAETDQDADQDGATDPPRTWSLGGADGSKFEIEGGSLKFKKQPDYEKPTDADMDNVYEVTVQASDGKLTGMLKVKVTVSNENEEGVVTLDKVTPVVGIPVTATLKDADGGISKLTWQWSIRSAVSSTEGDIAGATSDTYTPKAGDVDGALTATASYFDGQNIPSDIAGNATKKTAFNADPPNVERDTRNKVPVFGDEDPDTRGVQNSAATRKVEENTTDTVGAPVAATDSKADGNEESLQYRLSGRDMSSFRVNNSGQITVGSGTKLNYEGKRTYMVTVTATDPLGASSSIPVTIEVTNADEAPEISGDDMISYPEKGTNPVATYTASDPEGASVRWSLSGVDAEDFTIEDGVLRFAKTPDYESAKGGATDTNTYTVVVKATDETRRVASKTVMVKVTNVDEEGKVELSALRPQSATALTATLSDPDGATSNAKWQWSKSSSKNGAYSPIDKATSATYIPKDGDIPFYLRATVTYTDPEGEDKTAKMESDFTVQGVRGSNMAPEFAADQDPNTPEVVENAARSVAENTEAGSTVGDPVTADPKDGDVLTYTLEDEDGRIDGPSANFDIDRATGQILTKKALDYEATGGPSYTFVVRATDPAGVPGADATADASDTVTVVITVTDVNDAPVVGGMEDVAFQETTDTLTSWSETYAETDQDADQDGATDPPRTWSLGGADGSKFEIEGGSLKFKKQPDYEKPTDADMDNVYEVTVQASDGKLTGMLKVKVTVSNENEEGVVTLDKVTPVVGIPVTATLKDADGGISKLTWQWSIRSAVSSTEGDIAGATSDTYTPKAGDVDGALTATASYFDGQNIPSDIAGNATKKTAFNADPPNVERDTRNKVPVFGDEDPDTRGVQNSAATRKVEENTTDTVGAPVAATDSKADGNEESLQYRLSGRDMSSFRVNNSGQITVGSGTKLNYEGKRTYMVTVTATDPLGASSSIPVTIEVTNADEAPEIMRAPDANVAPEFADSEDGARSVAENTVAGEDIGNPVAASDANGDALTYALSGTDTASFDIDPDTGQLMTLAALDYETKATYSVTVTASDSGGLSDTIDVTITVTNVDEPGRVTLWAGMDALTMAPQVGETITGAVMDPDGGVTSETWQWSRTKTPDMVESWMPITGATAAAYMVTAGDTGYDLRVMATYTDAAGTDMAMVYSMPTLMVTMNASPMFETDTDTRVVAENTEEGMDIGAPVTATDDNNDTLTYVLGGTDAVSFDIDTTSGQLMTLATLDYETKATYSVTVAASDSGGLSDTIDVTITVTNVDEMGEVTLWAEMDALTMAPQVGDTITGAVMDPDGGVMVESWQWARTMDTANMNSWMDIEDASVAAYMVMADDTGYYLRVMATYTDAAGPDMAMVYSMPTMMVTMNASPMFETDTDTRVVAENTEEGMDIGAPVTATDDNNDTLTYTLVGTDAASFDINPATGQLMTKAALDFETKGSYSVMVTATDPDSASDMITVTITVTNEDEMGEVTLWAGTDALTMAPQVGETITGAVMDPDGGVTGETWQWSRSMDMTDWEDIGTDGMYTVIDDDAGYYLRATAMYDDGEGSGKNAMATTGSAVTDVDEADRTSDAIRLEIEEAILDAVLSDGIDDAERSAIERLIMEFALAPSS